MQDSFRDLLRGQWINMAFAALVLAAVFVLFHPQGNNLNSFTFTEDEFSVNAPDGSVSHIAYADISGMELSAVSDYGEADGGGSSGASAYGIWHNERFGDYLLYANINLQLCIIITLNDSEIFVFNMESDNDTRFTYEAFTELIENYTQK